MSTRVAIPMLYASLRLHLDKGRRWNIVEHLLLYRIHQQPCTAATLSEESNLPWRLVVEVMIRLMRVGWVELKTQGDEIHFQATASGKAVVGLDSLPKITRPVSRWAGFAIDQVTGMVFRTREFASLYTMERLQRLQEASEVILLPRNETLPSMQPSKIIEMLLDEDEECKDMDPSGARPVERFAVVTVVGETIDGLPLRCSQRLRSAILDTAGVSATDDEGRANVPGPAITTDKTEQGSRLNISFSHDDLIIGGKEHEVIFERILRKAHARVVIHSTFIDPQRFRYYLPLIEEAAKRGARIDVLWGKSNDADGSNSTADAVALCRTMLLSDIVRERVRLHGLSTESHAKLILADNGKGGLVALVGSCNWLSSGFKSYEVSAYLRDPAIIAQIAGHMASMTMGRASIWSPLTRELASLASSAKNAKAPKGGVRVKAELVFGSQHNAYMLLARDEARREITVASHRLSPNAETLVLAPARSALQSNNVDVHLFFGKIIGSDGGGAAEDLARAARINGMRANHILDPRLHAKFLAWDEDSVVITSQNWLSADPPAAFPYSEIGIYLSGSGLAQEVVERTRAALKF